MKPDLSAMMRQLVKPEAVQPDKWSRTFEAYGWTADMIERARVAEIERRIREAPEVIDG